MLYSELRKKSVKYFTVHITEGRISMIAEDRNCDGFVVDIISVLEV